MTQQESFRKEKEKTHPTPGIISKTKAVAVNIQAISPGFDRAGASGQLAGVRRKGDPLSNSPRTKC
jgi:hypothetical protein